MRKLSPTLRLSFGIMSLTMSLLLTAKLLGLLPDPSASELEARKKVCEALAVQLSMTTERGRIEVVEATLQSVVERNPDVLSAGLRQTGGSLLASAGDHVKFWRDIVGTASTPTHVQVPIFQHDKRWATLELVFTPLSTTFSLGNLASVKNSFVGLFAFVIMAGFGAYFLFLRRALRELDPANVIPERVKAAFNALSEGLLIIDEQENIVLANSAFAAKVERTPEALTGRRISDLDWRPWKAGDGVDNLPWRRARRSSESQVGVPLLMCASSGAMHSFMVNCAPIVDDSGKTRGILATFDDITEVERRNAELQRMKNELEKTNDEVSRQNNELRFLASRDPLTSCLNRRAFFECFETALAEARERGQSLACIMADIDHFKSINDRFGHATGDKVITSVAEVLRSVLRDNDLVGRYGGEEFCVILPGLSRDDAVLAAERVRRKIREGFGARLESEVRVTISLGVASLEDGASTVLELVNQADNALYGAKECGRNRVMRWGDTLVVERRAAADRAVISAVKGSEQSVTAEAADHGPDTRDASPTLEIHVLRERLGELEAGRGAGGQDNPFREGYDVITGLPGYLLFCDRVSQMFAGAKRAQTAAAILCVGVETFRRINNTLGSAVGDALLRAVGERIDSVVRGSDTVAWLAAADGPASVSRLGGDEFGVALGSLLSAESTTWIVKRLLERLAEPFEIAGHEIYLTAAIGVSLYPTDSENVEDLLRCAGAARHHAEENPGPNRYVFFAREMNDLSYQQISLDAQMRHAIQRGEFLLHYQPKLDLRTGKITAVEALLRWQHPELGLVSPQVFVPIAERTGFITEIGDWVLRTACLQAKQWLDDGLAICVAVNLSAVQLRSEQFVGRLSEILAEVGIPARYLELEVTETAVMADLEGAGRQLHELRRIGALIAIDDFGTGYSSLSYLKRFAADTLKIDGSFVADIAVDPSDATLVAAIIAMAHRLGLQAVAEGVETGAQLAQLRRLQCDAAQGYLFSPPVPAEQLLALLKSDRSLVPPAETDIGPRRVQGPAARSKAGDRTGAGNAI